MGNEVRAVFAVAVGGAAIGLVTLATTMLAGEKASTITKIILGVEGIWFGVVGLIGAAVVAFHD